MKKYLFILAVCLGLNLEAQENAQDYILPSVYNQKYLYSAGSAEMNGDISEIKTSLSWINLQYHAIYQEDGSVAYKVVHFGDGMFDAEDYAYFLKFSGNTGTLSGYSNYVVESPLFYEQAINEEYKTLQNQPMYKAPSESYQSLEWTFTDPNTGSSVNASSYYKTMKVHGYDKRILIVEFNRGGQTTKEYYMKHYGLIALQKGSDLHIADFSKFKLYSKSYMDGLKEVEARDRGWGTIERLRLIKGDSLVSGKESYTKYINSMDSLHGLYEHLMLKYPEKQNVYRYIISLYTFVATSRMFEKADKDKQLTSRYSEIMRPALNYYFIRPYAEAVAKSGLSDFVTKVDENYYANYWKMNYYILKTQNGNGDFEKEYKAFLMNPRIIEILKSEANMDNATKCTLYSFAAVYYFHKGDEAKRYYYLVKYVEYFNALSQADKDLNIEYMRGVMKNLATLNPGDETVLVSAINAVNSLKDYPNATRIAINGYEKGLGSSLAFGMGFAEAAHNNEVDKENLRKAMKLLENKYKEMNVEQINKYLVYCRAMSPEFDCSKAESEVKKARKRDREKEEQKLKEEKKKNRSSSGSRASNFAISANPFAGLNLKGDGGTFKFLPLSAELRIGSTLHEFRVNTFMGLTKPTIGRFIGGKILGDVTEENAGWKNIRGADYSYALFFVKNEISSYKKTCYSFGGGLQLLYGSFTSDPETLDITQNKIATKVTIHPTITRFEGLINLKQALFSWKSHLFVTMFYGFGAGKRSIDYNAEGSFKESDLQDQTVTTFNDRRYIQQNWSGAYFTFRMGFRFGFTIF